MTVSAGFTAPLEGKDRCAGAAFNYEIPATAGRELVGGHPASRTRADDDEVAMAVGPHAFGLSVQPRNPYQRIYFSRLTSLAQVPPRAVADDEDVAVVHRHSSVHLELPYTASD